jgi:DMSO/TMAO reductase YedYZ heme-binding membrane subunit
MRASPMRNSWKRVRLLAYLIFFTGLALFFLEVSNDSNASWGLLMVSSSPLIYMVANTLRMIEILAIAKVRNENDRK